MCSLAQSPSAFYRVVLMMVLGSLLAGCSGPPPPSDKKLIDLFHKERGAFDRLLEICRAYPPDGKIELSGEDGAEARRLMKHLGIFEIYRGEDDVTFNSTSFAFSPYEKGYIFVELEKGLSPRIPNYTVDSLDGLEWKAKATMYRSLEGGWYLYLTPAID